MRLFLLVGLGLVACGGASADPFTATSGSPDAAAVVSAGGGGSSGAPMTAGAPTAGAAAAGAPSDGGAAGAPEAAAGAPPAAVAMADGGAGGEAGGLGEGGTATEACAQWGVAATHPPCGSSSPTCYYNTAHTPVTPAELAASGPYLAITCECGHPLPSSPAGDAFACSTPSTGGASGWM